MSDLGFGWFSRRRALRSGKDTPQAPAAGAKRRSRLGIMALEPRIMYDAAAAATVGAAAHHHDGAMDHAAITAAEQHAPPVTPSNTGHVEAHDHNGQPQPLAQAPNVQTPPAASEPAKTASPLDASATPAPASGGSPREVVFIDPQSSDLMNLYSGVKSGDLVFVLDPSKDGVQQIADILAAQNLHDLDAIHIVSHGEEAEVRLGTTVLSDSNVADHAAALAAIGASLKSGGDILLYGCDVAAGADGQKFITDLARLTGADIAASTDDTGSADLGGNWTLEASTGAITATNPFTDSAMANYEGLLSIAWTVRGSATSTGVTGTDAFPAATGSTRLVTADFNNDGKLDILYQVGATANTGIALALGNGDGTFQAPINAAGGTFATGPLAGVSLSSVVNESSVYASDLNGDGRVDLIIDPGASGLPTVYQNTGSGFSRVANPFPAQQFTGRFLIGDFNNDGYTDILNQAGNTSGTNITLYVNKADGTIGFNTIAQPTSAAFASGPLSGIAFTQVVSSTVFAVDLNGDGKVDIVDDQGGNGIATPVKVYQNNGAGYSAITSPFPAQSFTGRFVFGDFNSDGFIDVLNENSDSNGPTTAGGNIVPGSGYTLYLNSGTGSIAFTAIAKPNGSAFTSGPLAGIDFTNISYQATVVADWDHDGDADILDLQTGSNRYITQGATSNVNGHPPQLASSTPGDNATGVSPSANISLTFNESVSRGSAGDIYIVRTSDNTVVETIPVTDTTRVTGSGTTWIINPTITLAAGTAYAVRVDSGSFVDSDGAVFFGINDNTTLNFQTVAGSPPTITSNGGGASAALNVAENGTAVTTVAATDPDAGTTLTYSISGGADRTKFAIDSSTGVLTFVAAPDFEHPTDANADNVYNVTVQVSDGAQTDSQAIAVTVTNVNEAPAITSNGGGAAAALTVAENSTAVTTVTATDPDAGTTLTYSISGTDAAKFAINPGTGVLTFVAAPDFEHPADANADNIYNVVVQVSDGSLTDSQAIAVTVTDVNDNAPVFTSGTTATTAENVATTTAVYTAAATDADATTANNTVTYSLDGTDANLFNINATSGAVTFKASPNYEAPANADANNVYLITVHAKDGAHDVTRNVAITVTDINDTAPVITTAATQPVAENTTQVAALTSTDADTVGTNPATFSISGGADAAKFAISGGSLVFVSAPDYEHPGSSAGTNAYVVEVSAFDGINTTAKTITVNVTDVNEAPTAIADVGTAGENETKSFDVTANDTDPDAGDSKTLSSIAVGTVASGNSSINGIDASALFSIVGNQVKFTPGTQFDALQANETATVVIGYTVKDSGNLSSSSTFTLTVNGTNDAPVATITPTSPFSVTEQTPLDLKTRGLSVSDVDGGTGIETVTLAVSEGTLTVTAGNSGAVVTSSGSPSVTITGTVAQINALLNSDGTSTVSYSDNTDAPAASATLTLSISDSSSATSTATSAIALVAVNDAPTATITSAGYSATEGVSLSLKGTGLSVGDVDGGAGIETVTLSVGEGVLTVTAGDSGVATIANSGTSTVTVTGTLTQINALLGASGTSSINYIDNTDRPSASTMMTLSINDGGNSGGGALTATASKSIAITAVGDAPVGAADSYSVGTGASLLVGSTAGVLSNDVDPDGNAMTAVLVTGPSSGALTLNTDGSFTYTPSGTTSVTDSFTYRAVQGGLQSAPITVTLNVVAALPATLPSDQYWITTEANTYSSDPTTEALIAGNTRLMVTTSSGGTPTIVFQDTVTGDVQTPVQLPDHIVIDYINNLYFITAYQSQGNGYTTGSVYVGHLNSAAAPVLVYHNPDTDRGDGAAIIDLAIDPVAHNLIISQDANYANGVAGNNGIFSYSYNTTTGALGAKVTLASFDPTYSDSKVGIQTNYMSSQPVNGILYYQTVNYTTWAGTFQIYALNIATGVSTALMPGGQFPVNYHDNSGQFLGDMELDPANSKLYFTGFTTAGAGTSSVYDISVTGPAGTNVPHAVAITGIGTLKLQDIAYNSDNGQFAFTDPNNQRVDLFTVSGDGNTLAFASSFTLGLQAPKTDGSDPSQVFGTPGAPFIYPTSIFFTPADKAPVITMTTSTYAATEQLASSLKNTISVSDPDAGTSTETVTLNVDEGTLTATAGGSGAIVSGSGSKTVTITGTLAQINSLLGSDASSTVNYSDNTDTPSSHATLTLSINDGRGITATKVALITIAAVNDAPLATITPPAAATYAATEQVALDLKSAVAGKGLSVSDVDGGNGIESVTLSVGEGILNVTSGSSGASVSGSGTSSVTITSTIAQINALLRTDATSSVTYLNPNDAPASSTVLTLQINDNGNTGAGGAKTAQATATIAITAVNDAPVAVADLYAMQTGTLSATTVLANDTDVDTPHGSLTAVLVSGPGHLAASGPGGSAAFTLNADGTFTYTPNAGFSGSDYFTYKVSDGTGFSNTVTVTINVAGSPITAVTDTYSVNEDTGLTVNAATGVLANDTDTGLHALSAAVLTQPAHGTLVLNADGSFAYTPNADYYGTDSFTYRVSNTAGDPPAIGTVIITVAPVNDAPVLAPQAPGDAGYVENATPTPLFVSETISDADNPVSFNNGTLTVAITSGAQTGDQIALLATSGFSVDGTGHLRDGGIDLGTVTASGTSFSVLLSANATPAEVNRLATAFGFANTTDSPGSADRTVTLTFNDGGNVGSGAHNDVSVEQIVHVTPVDDAPVVGAGHAAAYTEQAAAIVIDGALTVTDVDSAMLSGVTVAINNFVAGDVLGVDTSGTGIQVVSNANGVLVLSGADTVADYQALLRRVTFANTSNDPTVGGTQSTRTITWTATDDTNQTSAPATTSIAITAVNDAPTVTVATGLRGLPGAAVVITGVSFDDVDAGSGQEKVTFSAGSGSFAATTGGGVTVDTSVAHVVTLTGKLADLNAFVANGLLAFTPLAGAASTDISIVIDDQGNTGGAAQHSAAADLVIIGNTPPSAPADLDSTANTVQEGAAAGTAVGITASSTDADNDPLTFSIVGRGAAAFQIDATSGVVTVRDGSLIDYESNAGHATTITVQASDGHGGVTTTDFTIAVTDRAPSVPVDVDAATGGSISEGAATGDSVGITAASVDVNGGTVTYSLSDNAGGRFQINTTTGVVTVANASLIDYETATSHQITVVASDGTLTTSQNFTIAVTDVAPTAPVDTDGITGGSVSEGAVNGAQVGITASSTDVHGGTVTYTLTDNAGGRFTIDASTGIVTVLDASLLDYESQTSHSITVAVSDGTLTSSQTFTIAVTDVAPTAPVDGSAAADSVSEGAVNGDTVGITATSSDVHGGQVTFSLTNNAGGRFAIDSSTGVVTVANAALLNFESATSHDIVVRAADPSGSFTETTYTIAVTDVAPTPVTDADGTANTVAESAAHGSSVGITAASTDIHGGTVTYTLSEDAGGRFQIDAATGVVTVNNASLIDYETATSHQITVVASDGTLTTSQNFTIAVIDVAPTTPIDVDGVPGGLISEGAVNGAQVGIQASSADVHGGAVTYTLADNAGGRFTIDSGTGVVTMLDASLLDYESQTSHTIIVRASDPSGLFNDQTFTIAVTDVAPTAPVNSTGATGGAVSEGAANGDLVGITAAATDIHGGTVTYSLTDNAGGRFAIDAATGLVTVANASLLDYETATSHNITIRAADPSGLFTDTVFTIAVTDVAPTLAVDTDGAANTVVEGAAPGTTVGITAGSSDIHGGTVSFALSADSSNGGFAIDAATGVVTVADAGKVDFESSGGSYTIKVKASDPSGSFTEQTFTIAVTDVKPTAGADAFATDEDTPLVVSAAQGLLVNDSDINGAPLTAVLVAGPSHGTLQLNADGSFRYLGAQDYNGTDSFTYRTSDGTLLSDPVTVSLSIRPVNDAPVLVAGNTLSFDANTGQPVTVAPAIALHDVDSTTMSHASVAISAGLETADDRLNFVNQNGITGSYDSATGVLTLSGTASVANYQAALASVTFSSTTQRDGSRTVLWTVDDGSAQFSQSAPTTTTLGISGIIVPPHMFGDSRPPLDTHAVTPVAFNFDRGGFDGAPPQGGDDNHGGPGRGFAYHMVDADAVLKTASNNDVQIDLALSALSGALGGDVAFVTARLANGDPLPKWLAFDPATGSFAGLPPEGMVAAIEGAQSDADLATGTLPPDADLGKDLSGAPATSLKVEVVARDSKGNLAVTVFTIDLRPRTGKHGWNIDRNTMPSNIHRHAGLIERTPELAAIEAAVRDATGIAARSGLGMSSIRLGGADAERSNPPAAGGRAGLSEQLASVGWRAMQAQRNALLASLQQGR